MISKTYDEWKAQGYQVVKGQKATGRNELGKATFRGDQVIGEDDADPDDPMEQWLRGEYP